MDRISTPYALARIHALPCHPRAECLLDGNREALWFANAELAEPLLSHEDGPLLWRLIHDLRPHLRPVPSRLMHSDHWLGNVLWQGDQISAILGWEEVVECQQELSSALPQERILPWQRNCLMNNLTHSR